MPIVEKTIAGGHFPVDYHRLLNCREKRKECMITTVVLRNCSPLFCNSFLLVIQSTLVDGLSRIPTIPKHVNMRAPVLVTGSNKDRSATLGDQCPGAFYYIHAKCDY